MNIREQNLKEYKLPKDWRRGKNFLVESLWQIIFKNFVSCPLPGSLWRWTLLTLFGAKLGKKIPAGVHVDNSCRVQTVSKQTNLRFYNLIKEFYALTSIPILLNTSFNIKGQPMVNTPDQALSTFKSTNIDVLVIGDYVISK